MRIFNNCLNIAVIFAHWIMFVYNGFIWIKFCNISYQAELSFSWVNATSGLPMYYSFCRNYAELSGNSNN